MSINKIQSHPQRNVKASGEVLTYNLDGRVCLQFGLDRLDFSPKEARVIATALLKLSNELEKENIKPKAK